MYLGVELSSKKRKLQWNTDDADDDIDVEQTLELRQVHVKRMQGWKEGL